MLVSGDAAAVAALGAETGAHVLGPGSYAALWGPGRPHPELEARLPEHVLLAPPGRIVLPRGFDKRLVGYHGGLDAGEVEIPLLVG